MPHTRGIQHIRIHRRRPEYRPEKQPRSREGMAAYQPGYLESLQVRHFSPMTVRNREQALTRFIAWANDRDLIRPEQITKPILESYQRWLYRYRKKNGQPLGLRSQVELLQTVKDFFRWLCRQNVLVSNPASELEMPRREHRLPVEALSVQEVGRVLSVPDVNEPLGVRDRAILETFYSTGMRRMELVNLQVHDLNRERRVIAIRLGKGRKDRVVPIGARALSWVGKYLEEVRPLLVLESDRKALFLSGYGEAFSRDVLGRMVSEYIKKACPGKKGGAHLFRHSCATHMLEGGADIRYIQQLLGHASLETTQVYTDVSIKQLQEVHARCHPAH